MAVPDLGGEHLAAIADSIYRDANDARGGYFDPEPGPAVRRALLAIRNPRGIRLAVEDALVLAASEGRRALVPADVREPRRAARRRIGFRD